MVALNWLEDPDKRRWLTSSFLELSADELAARTADLAAVRAGFEDVQRRIQGGRGFESTSTGGCAASSYPQVITTDDTFGDSGHAAYELVRVFKRFRFHPTYGEAGQAVPGVDRQQRPAEVLDAETRKLLPPDTALLEIRIKSTDRPSSTPATPPSSTTSGGRSRTRPSRSRWRTFSRRCPTSAPSRSTWSSWCRAPAKR